MKSLSVKLFVCIFFTINVFGQTKNEEAIFNSINDRIKPITSNLNDNEFIVFAKNNKYFVVEKSDMETLYILSYKDNLIRSICVDSSFISNNFFSNFKPKLNVKNYVSETYNNFKCPSHMIYFAIFEKGIKTFESWLPTLLLCGNQGQSAEIEYPYNDEIFLFFHEIFTYY